MIRELKGRAIDKAFAEGEVITSNMGHDDEGNPIDERFYADDGPLFAGENEAAERQHLLQRKEAMERKGFDRKIDHFCVTGKWEDK